MTVAALYARISQDRTEVEAGIERQLEDCRDIATRNGWDVGETFIDNDASASQPLDARSAFMDLLAEADRFGAIVAWRDVRLWRDPDHQRTAFAICRDVGIEAAATSSAATAAHRLRQSVEEPLRTGAQGDDATRHHRHHSYEA